MAKSTAEKLSSTDEKIKQLMDERKHLAQKKKAEERKARESRLKKRHGLLEDALPETIGMTDEQYKIFISRAVANDTVRKIIANILAVHEKSTSEKGRNELPTDDANATKT